MLELIDVQLRSRFKSLYRHRDFDGPKLVYYGRAESL